MRMSQDNKNNPNIERRVASERNSHPYPRDHLDCLGRVHLLFINPVHGCFHGRQRGKGGKSLLRTCSIKIRGAGRRKVENLKYKTDHQKFVWGMVEDGDETKVRLANKDFLIHSHLSSH